MSPAASADLDAIFARFAAPLERELRAVVPPVERSGLYRMLVYHLGWTDPDGLPTESYGGKKLRPSLLLLATEAAGGDPAIAMPAAAGVELLHNFSLIHDDIQDGSPERRHRAAVWAIWGSEQAINAGDAMHAVAARAVLRCAETGAAAGDVIEAAALLHDACLRLVEGQYLDLTYERRNDVTPDEYLQMIDGKTAALLAACAEIGAILGGGSSRRQHWRDFGVNLGRAFQIVDDVLGIWGDARVTGKPTADDVSRGKRSLPYLLAREALPAPDRSRLDAIYRAPRRDPPAVAEAIALLDRAGSRSAVEARAEQHLEGALRALDRAEPRPVPGEQLRQLARFVVARER